jgi:hypothetical protein
MDLSEKHFKRQAQHHAVVGKHHHALANAGEKGMRKATAKSDLQNINVESLSEFLDLFIETHNALGDENMEMAEHCAECAKRAGEDSAAAAEKAAAARFEKREGQDAIVPTNIRAVYPAGLVAVPRPGQQAPAAAPVSTQFSKLIAVDEEAETSLQK